MPFGRMGFQDMPIRREMEGGLVPVPPPMESIGGPDIIRGQNPILVSRPAGMPFGMPPPSPMMSPMMRPPSLPQRAGFGAGGAPMGSAPAPLQPSQPQNNFLQRFGAGMRSLSQRPSVGQPSAMGGIKSLGESLRARRQMGAGMMGFGRKSTGQAGAGGAY